MTGSERHEDYTRRVKISSVTFKLKENRTLLRGKNDHFSSFPVCKIPLKLTGGTTCLKRIDLIGS